MPEMKIIARISTPFKTKFGIPRQSGVAPDVKGEIVFEPDYREIEAVRGLEGFSHIWLIWCFSESVSDKRFARRASAVMYAWAFLRRARRSDRTLSACHP